MNRNLQIGLLTKANVQGHGIGKKIVDDKPTGRRARVIYVDKKLPLVELNRLDVIPEEIDGLPSDVQEVGKIKALKMLPRIKPNYVDDRLINQRPTPCGVSIGHPDITAGTMGAVVEDPWNHGKLILSNNHVLANSNKGTIGDDIYQPGSHDGGDIDDAIGTLESFVEIKFLDIADCQIAKWIAGKLNTFARMLGSTHYLKVHNSAIEFNRVDAAAARPFNDADIHRYQLSLGDPTRILNTSPLIDDFLQKSGRTTGVTQGFVQATEVTTQVQYGDGLIAVFENQIMAGPMSAGGDSGSLVLDARMNPTGLLFAGSDQVTVINPIADVVNELGVDF